MSDTELFSALVPVLARPPQAVAAVRGSEKYPAVHGTVRFYQTAHGVLVAAEMAGLPSPAAPCASPVFAFHIHSGGTCSGNAADPFANAMSHYDPQSCPHPHHAGDLPPLFGCHGRALAVVLTDRFALADILGMTVIVHAGVDDFTTQPAGNAGEKMACGVIRANITQR